MSTNLPAISQAVQKGDQHETVKLVKEALAGGTSAVDILNGALVPGVQALGEKFKDGEVFLPEVMITIRAMNMGLDEIRELVTEADIRKRGTVVLGTVEGDVHDIGKNLVGMMLDGNGYKKPSRRSKAC